jgi:hypothetical protein
MRAVAFLGGRSRGGLEPGEDPDREDRDEHRADHDFDQHEARLGVGEQPQPLSCGIPNPAMEAVHSPVRALGE